MTESAIDRSLRRVVLVVALLNLGYFGVEFAVALAIGSVSLFADSIDFLEDASVNLLIFFAMAWSAARRARVGMALALILLVPGLATLWTAWEKFLDPAPPAPFALSLAGLGRARRQSRLRVPARRLSPSQGQPDQGGVPVRAQRRAGQCGDHRGRVGDGICLALRLA